MCVLTFPNYKKNYKCVSSQLYTTYILNFNMVDIVCAKKNSRVYIRHPDNKDTDNDCYVENMAF